MKKNFILFFTKKPYELSNNELYDLFIETHDLNIINEIVNRFKHDLCKREGESNEDVFARLFDDFANGRLSDYDKVAERMVQSHRYIQGEMFWICMAYVRKLAECYSKGWFDARNERACKTAKRIVELVLK